MSRIPRSRPAIGDAERAAADRALASGQLVAGGELDRFEDGLARHCQRAHAVCVASASAALELSLWALGVGPGDEVLVTGFASVTAANAVARLGAVPVPVDVARPHWNLDVDAARAALSGRTRGIVSVDQLGLAAEPEPIAALAADHGLWLVADASRGFGATTASGRPAGNGGRIATLSFAPDQLITAGEGGAVLTDDGDLAALVRQLRDGGRDTAGRHGRVGTGACLSEVSAAIGRAQLGRIDGLLAERRLLARGYFDRLARPGQAGAISWQDPGASAMHAYQTFAVELVRRPRDAVIEHLASRGIEAGPAAHALCRMPACAGGSAVTPVAVELDQRVLALPMYSGMRSAELDRVADALAEVLR